MYGVVFCCIGIVALIPIGAAFLLVLLSLAPGLPENAMALWWIGTLGACVGTVIYAIRRYRQIDRYFAERHADALHRWFFRPGRGGAGVSGAKRDVAIPFFGASCGLASMLFIDPAVWWAVAAATTALAGSLVLVLASRRRRWVDEWFDRHGSAER